MPTINFSKIWEGREKKYNNTQSNWDGWFECVNYYKFYVILYILDSWRCIAHVPIKSDGTFPLLNRPVGLPPLKSLPYGG